MCVCVQGFVLQSLKLLMKVHQRRNKRRADAIDDSALQGSNVLYAMVDPHSEWIASVTVLQSEAMLKLQLQHSQSVLAQSAAVQALSHMVAEARRGRRRFVTQHSLRGDSGQLSLSGVQALLIHVLKNRDVFYRCAWLRRGIATAWCTGRGSQQVFRWNALLSRASMPRHRQPNPVRPRDLARCIAMAPCTAAGSGMPSWRVVHSFVSSDV